MSRCPTWLYHFEPVTDTELLKIISCMHKTTCSSDPFPTRLLMSHIHAIVPILQHIVNLCLTTGDFPISCKSSIVPSFPMYNPHPLLQLKSVGIYVSVYNPHPDFMHGQTQMSLHTN